MPKEKNPFRIPVYGKGDRFLARPQIAGTITARDSSLIQVQICRIPPTQFNAFCSTNKKKELSQ